jgi:hypothetical protein
MPSRDWMGAFRILGRATENLRQGWSYSSTPSLDLLVRVSGVISIFIGAWVVLAMTFASQRGPYVRFLLVLVVFNLVLLSVRAWMRRR